MCMNECMSIALVVCYACCMLRLDISSVAHALRYANLNREIVLTSVSTASARECTVSGQVLRACLEVTLKHTHTHHTHTTHTHTPHTHTPHTHTHTHTHTSHTKERRLASEEGTANHKKRWLPEQEGMAKGKNRHPQSISLRKHIGQVVRTLMIREPFQMLSPQPAQDNPTRNILSNRKTAAVR